MTSALYAGRVVHQRTRPTRHHLAYRVFSLLLDLDELPALGRRLRWFGFNRWAPFSFFEKDHGDGAATGLRAWVDRQLSVAGLVPAGGHVAVLCYPRIFGYVFNPLSVYFCHASTGALQAILYEVHNTYGERHTYVIPVDEPVAPGCPVEQSCRKEFYVSPFVPMDCVYRFRIGLPGEKVGLTIAEDDAEGHLLTAVFTGRRRTLSDGALARALLEFPLMTLKVFAGIRWEALKLWRKRVPLIPHSPAARPIASTVVMGGSARHRVAAPERVPTL